MLDPTHSICRDALVFHLLYTMYTQSTTQIKDDNSII